MFWMKLKDQDNTQYVFKTRIGELIKDVLAEWDTEVEHLTKRLTVVDLKKYLHRNQVKPAKELKSSQSLSNSLRNSSKIKAVTFRKKPTNMADFEDEEEKK